MAPFGGYLMPIQYTGILAEHSATRERATVFDTGHMGELHVSGRSALDDLERLVTCRVHDLPAGRCRYGMLCAPDGGVIDDLLVYRLGEQAFMLVVNAGPRAGDVEWIASHLSAETRFEDRSEATAKIDLQGPMAPRIAADLLDGPIGDLRFYAFKTSAFRGTSLLVSRTGYTGEMGFEFYIDASTGADLWDACLEQGATPAGLGARDTLRLEMGMPLYGHELGRSRNAAQSGFTRAIAGDKDFVGSDAVRACGEETEVLVGLELEGRRAARPEDRVTDSAGKAVGAVTSGSFGPSVGKAVALAYVRRAFAGPGTRLAIAGRRRPTAATVAALPFYKRGTARLPLSGFIQESDAGETIDDT